MAELVLKFNTVDKTMTVTIDGQEIPDVMEVHAGVGYEGDDCHCCVSTVRRDEESGLTTMYRIMAADSRQARRALQFGEARVSKAHAGFVEQQAGSKVALQVAEYFGGRHA